MSLFPSRVRLSLVLAGVTVLSAAALNAQIPGSRPLTSPQNPEAPNYDLIVRTVEGADLAGWRDSVHRRHQDVEVVPVFRPIQASRPMASRLVRYSRLRIEDPGTANQLEAALANDPNVETVSRASLRVEWLGGNVPDDPYYSSVGSWGQSYEDQWGLHNIDAETAWDIETGSTDLVIAVLDTGVDYLHPELDGRMWVNDAEDLNSNGVLDASDINGIDDDGNGYIDDIHGLNFPRYALDQIDGTNTAWDVMDNQGHGTHIAGIIGAETDNGEDMAGVNWGSKLMAVTLFGDSGFLAESIQYAADNGATVINASWATFGDTDIVSDAIAYAHALGCVFVAAAGNSRIQAETFFPQSDPYAIVVSAFDQQDEPTLFTNFGVMIDVAAPGGGRLGDTPAADPVDGVRNVLGTRWSGTSAAGFVEVTPDLSRGAGTSFAAPFVVGVVSLIQSQNPGLSSEQIRQALRHTAADVLTPGWDPDSGAGRLDAGAAVTDASDPFGEALITSPRPRANLQGIGTLDIEGSAWAPASVSFDGYMVDYGAGIDPASWTLLGDDDSDGYSDTSAVQEAALVSDWDSSELDVGLYTLRVRVSVDRGATVYENRTVFSVGPPSQTGFPATAPNAGIMALQAPVVCGDVDGDGEVDIVQPGGAFSHYVSVLENDGTLKVTIDLGLSTSVIFGGAALGELDSTTSGLEIVVVTDDGVYAFHGDGTTVSGWPYTGSYADSIAGRPIVADLDDDGDMEVLARVFGGGDDSLVVLDHEGNFLWEEGGLNYGTELAVADIRGDSALEIVLAGQGEVRVLDDTGAEVDSVAFGASGSSNSVALGDLRGDRGLDIAVITTSDGSATGSVTLLDGDDLSTYSGFPQIVEQEGLAPLISGISPHLALGDVNGDLYPDISLNLQHNLFAFDRLGNHLTEDQEIALFSMHDEIVLGDVSGDGQADLIASNFLGQVFAHEWDSGAVPGWPLVSGETWGGSPSILDLDGDNDLEVVMFSQAFFIDFDNFYVDPGVIDVWDTDGQGPSAWPMPNADVGRTGAFVDRRGDADHDGELTQADAQLLLDYLFLGGAHPVSFNAADVNNDGDLDISDPIYLLNYLYQGGPPPAD